MKKDVAVCSAGNVYISDLNTRSVRGERLAPLRSVI